MVFAARALCNSLYKGRFAASYIAHKLNYFATF